MACYRLRFSDFHLAEGYLHLPRTKTKNKRAGVVTIPDSLRDFLMEDRFTRYPANYLLFGAGGHPHASQPAGENTFKRRHAALLDRLRRERRLGDTRGLSLYSWKDTGMTEFAKFLKPFELRDQARYASVDQILTYYHADRVNANVKAAKFKLPPMEEK